MDENIRDWNISRQIVWGMKIPNEGETDTLIPGFPPVNGRLPH